MLPDFRPLDDASVAQSAGKRKTIAILGATGTVGRNTVAVARSRPDLFDVHTVTANADAQGLAEIAVSCGARRAIVADPDAYPALRCSLDGTGIEAAAGMAEICDAMTAPIDLVMAAIVGVAGLEPALRAVRNGLTLALANKECMVAAAPVFRLAAERSGAVIVPIDSEHSAIFQAIGGAAPETVEKVTITASGGPFRTWSRKAMESVTPAIAVRHPNWAMGAKISVDSATLMNKGLELIEAAALFPFAADKLDVVVHPQSVIHAMVAFRDGSIIAQMGPADMRIPIAVGLAWPDRIDIPRDRIDFTAIARLDFEEPDRARFPALALAETALAEGHDACITLNAANEIAVEHFLNGNVPFLKIADIVAEVLSRTAGRTGAGAIESLEDVLERDLNARRLARRLCGIPN